MSSPSKQLATMLANVEEKTGKTMADWLALLANKHLDKHGQIVTMLKSDHGVTHGFANLIASEALKPKAESDTLEAQYSGGKAHLKPIYDAIVEYAKSLGNDVELAPKKASVSLRRKKQFALITPASQKRIDLGLALKGKETSSRLESYNAMCSHRVRIQTLDELDTEVKTWLAEAYQKSG